MIGCESGGSTIEKIVTVALLISAGAVGVRFLGRSTRDALDCEGQTVAGARGACKGTGTAPVPAALPTVASSNGTTAGRPATACTGPACLCFVAGTTVITEFGPQPIESITVGTMVLSRPERGGENAWKLVAQTIVSRSRSLVHLVVTAADGDNEAFDTTGNHPFFVANRGWVEARLLVPGQDRLVDQNHQAVEIMSAESVDRQEPVYNLEIADDHSYFVGRIGLWVHNAAHIHRFFHNPFGRPSVHGSGPSRPSVNPPGPRPAVASLVNTRPPRFGVEQIHTYWTGPAGGAIPPVELQNITAWGQAAAQCRPTPCPVTLWTTPDFLSAAQIGQLAAEGVAVRTDIATWMLPSPEQQYEDALSMGAWARASDLARYAALQTFGGLYIDPDIHPGTVNLSHGIPVPPNPDIPIIGPHIRDKTTWDLTVFIWQSSTGEFHRLPTNAELFPIIYQGSQILPPLNNNLMIAQPGAQFFSALTEQINANYADHSLEAEVGANTVDAAAFVTGPYPIMDTLGQVTTYPGSEYILSDPNWINGLNWLTSASEVALPPPPASTSQGGTPTAPVQHATFGDDDLFPGVSHVFEEDDEEYSHFCG